MSDAVLGLFSYLLQAIGAVGLLAFFAYLLGASSKGGPPVRKGDIVVITGASTGIGAELAKHYATRNCHLCLCARRKEELDCVAAECVRLGAASTLTQLCDVAQKEQVEAFVDAVSARHGSCDAEVTLILNAGIGQSFFLENGGCCEEPVFKQFMDVNFYGAVWCVMRAMPLLEKHRGRCVVISSLGGLVPFPRQCLYNASKFALVGFFDSLRLELMSRKSPVSVTMVCPGFVETEMTTKTALGKGGKQLGEKLSRAASGGGKMMSLPACIDCIIPAVDRRDRLAIMPRSLRCILWMYYLFPSLVDSIFVLLFGGRGKQKSG